MEMHVLLGFWTPNYGKKKKVTEDFSHLLFLYLLRFQSKINKDAHNLVLGCCIIL